MIVVPTKHFKKKAAKLPKSIKIKLAERICFFMDEPKNIVLNNHQLNGKYSGYRSINVTGNYRIIYEELGDGSMRLIDIGTHGELY
jgi:addiction module RelE/StbE family toxin